MLLYRPVNHSKLQEPSYKCGLDLICPSAYHHYTQLFLFPSLKRPSYPTIYSHTLSVLLRGFLVDEAH